MNIAINKNLMSRNHTSLKRTNSQINYIVVHYVGALGDAKANTDYYKNNDISASADFWVGFSGDIWQGNDYRNYYSWHCGGGLQGSDGHSFYGKCKNSNSVGIEMCVRKKSTKTMNATDKDWYFESKTIESAAQLVAYLMKELDIDIDHVIRHYDVTGKICPNPFVYNTGSVTWKGFKDKVASYAGVTINNTDSSDTVAYYRVRKTWKDTTSQIGAYTVLENAKANCPSGYSVYDENGKAVYTEPVNTTSGTQASDITGTEIEKASKMLELVRANDDSGILYSVTTAQMILESGYCTTDLAKNANNCFGMKCSLSNNTWETVWDGSSKYTKNTAEQDKNGNVYYVKADFRKYPCIEKSIKDHSCYLLGAMNGTKKRYAGLTDCKDYKTAITLIKNGGYATDTKYVSKVCNIIEKYSLNKYDSEIINETAKTDFGANSKVTTISEWLQTVKNWEQKMLDVGAIYNNQNNKTNYEVALKQNPVLTNCALFVTHALQVAGIFGKNDKFYGSTGTTIKGNAASKLKTIGKITTYDKSNVTADKATIPVGAIVTWHEGHTNVYLGKNEQGQMTWCDAGRGTTIKCATNSGWKSFRKTGNMSGYHVANVIALNLTDDTKKGTTSSKGTQYVVQAGAFAVEANAKKQAEALKNKGFDVIVKKRDNDWAVQCGVFKDKQNADNLIAKLKKAGFSAILHF